MFFCFQSQCKMQKVGLTEGSVLLECNDRGEVTAENDSGYDEQGWE